MAFNTFRDLEQYYERYLSVECANSLELAGSFNPRQWVFPGRCEKAREYVNKMKEFIQKTRENDKQSLEDDKKTLQERIENEEHKNIYPLLNHDFDYDMMVKKQYTPYALDITNRPTFSGMTDGVANNTKYARALLFDPLPNDTTIAGVSDTIQEESPERREIVQKTSAEDAKMPYPTFRKDYPECIYPTTGKYASSYFVRVGQCKTSIKSRDVCLGRGYTWSDKPNRPQETDKFMEKKDPNEPQGNKPSRPADVPPPPTPPPEGTCFKPRFIYVNNRSKGFAQMDGIVVSGLGDLREIAPDRLYSIMSGQSVEGAGILPCVDEEGFVGSYGVPVSTTKPEDPVPVPIPKKRPNESRLPFVLMILFFVFFIHFITRNKR